jgi:predicted TIM-barrel enzyme
MSDPDGEEASPRVKSNENKTGRDPRRSASLGSRFDRAEVLGRLRECIDRGETIVGAGAGTGISAKFEEQGGADLILVYNSGRFRMAGYGSNAGLLALGDANAIVAEMGEREILPAVKHTPVIAGVNGTDPTRRMRPFITGLCELGFDGVINFPSHGIIDGRWRESLEETGFGYDREVAMIANAAALDVFSMAYVFNSEDARQMTSVGVDVIVAHMGLTTGGSIGASQEWTGDLDNSVRQTQAIAEAASGERGDVIVLCHGGPIATPPDAEYVLTRTDAVGFIGASSMERLPVETAITQTTREFKNVRMR